MWGCSDGQQCPGSISAVSLHSCWVFYFCCVPGKALCPADSLVHWVCQCPLTLASGRLQFRWNWLELVLRQELVILWAHRLCIHCVLQVCAFVVCRPSAFPECLCRLCLRLFPHLHHPQDCVIRLCSRAVCAMLGWEEIQGQLQQSPEILQGQRFSCPLLAAPAFSIFTIN